MPRTLDHIVLNVRNMEEALRFYTEVLGLGPERVDEFREGKVPFPSVRINESSIIDLLPEAFWGTTEAQDAHRAPNLNHFCLSFDKAEWQEVCARLERSGISTDNGPMQLFGARGEGMSLYISDPEGNQLELRYYED